MSEFTWPGELKAFICIQIMLSQFDLLGQSPAYVTYMWLGKVQGRVQGFMINPNFIGILKKIKLGCHDGNIGELFLFV